MCEYGDKLYLATGHRGYVDEAVGQGHQGMLLIEVDRSSMTGSIVKSDLWHSFAQYIEADSNGIYLYEQSEGSRCTRIRLYSPNSGSTTGPFSVLEYGGSHTSAWAIPCYATVDGLALSSSNALGIGTSIDQNNYDNYAQDPYNIYLTVTPKSGFSEENTQIKWLTSYTEKRKNFEGVRLTKVNDNRFLVSWEESDAKQAPADRLDTLSAHKLHYLFVDGAGNKISSETVVDAPISDCAPILAGDKIVYYASNSCSVNFYEIGAYDGKFSKKTFRIAGANSIWNIENGNLIISGSGDLTFTSSGLPKEIKDEVVGIIINEGIKSIPERGFSIFSNLASVEISDGLESIGKEAFYGCSNLRDVSIPPSVTSIGEDIVWTGYFWTSDYSHVTYATIHSKCDTYAIQYAKNNNIRNDREHVLEADYTVDTEATCTGSGSKSLHCSVCSEKTNAVTIPAMGHSMGPWNEVTPRTCENPGQKSRKCTRCEYAENMQIEATGHDYTAGNPENGKVQLSCSECGQTTSASLPTAMTIWWRCGESSSYYYPYPKDLAIGQKLYVWVQPQFADDAVQKINDFVVDTGDGRTIDFGTMISYTYESAGTYTVSIYPKYAPSLKRSTTVYVSVNGNNGSGGNNGNNGDNGSSNSSNDEDNYDDDYDDYDDDYWDDYEVLSLKVKLKMKKPVASKKSATVRWKKLNNANRRKIDGVEVQMATDKNFKNIVRWDSVKKTKASVKIKNLKSKKKYWVRIRAYKIKDDAVHVSRWSAKKSLRVK